MNGIKKKRKRDQKKLVIASPLRPMRAMLASSMSVTSIIPPFCFILRICLRAF